MFKLFSRENTNKDRNTFLVMLVAGLVALAAAFILTVEKFTCLRTPTQSYRVA